MPPGDNGWNEWKRHVVPELERLSKCYESLDAKVDNLITSVAGLKVKAGVWGLIGAAIPVLIGLGIMAIRGAM